MDREDETRATAWQEFLLLPILRHRRERLQRRFEIIRDCLRDESLFYHPASRQGLRREIAGAAFGFSFFGFLISFF